MQKLKCKTQYANGRGEKRHCTALGRKGKEQKEGKEKILLFLIFTVTMSSVILYIYECQVLAIAIFVDWKNASLSLPLASVARRKNKKRERREEKKSEVSERSE